MSKHYLLVVTYKSFACASFTTNVVISESLPTFIHRNLKTKAVRFCDDTFVVNLWSLINKENYYLLRKYNPTNEGYIKFMKADYSTIVEEE